MAMPRDDPMRREVQRIARRSLGARSVRGEKLAEDATVTPAFHTHLETDITDGALLARLAGNESITGNWGVAGITGEFIPQSDTGVPTHSASLGTLYVDLATGDFYVNTDGGTTWLKIGPGSAGAHDIDGGSHTDKDTIASTWTLVAGGVFKCTSHATAPTGEIIPQIKTTTGAPSHTASEGTFCWNSVDNKLYVNNAGATAWTEIGAGGGAPTGTGFRHVTAGVEDAAAKLVDTADINADQVTYAKMQNVSATDKLLGRATAGAGDVEEIACTAAGRAILDDADAAAQRTTLGAAAATHTHSHILVFTSLAEDLASGVLSPRPCIKVVGDDSLAAGTLHGAFTANRATAIAGTAGTGTNTILIEASADLAFTSPVTLFTLTLDTATEYADSVLDNTWTSTLIYVRAKATAVGGTAPKDVVVTVYLEEGVSS